MSYANGTQNYNLPQTVGTDKRDWFDTNSAFAAIDAALYAAATGQAADAEAISTINSKLAADEADIAALQTASTSQAASISTLQTTVNGQATQIADVRQDAEDMITANNEGAAATSTRAYTIGDYFIYNDVLYKATAAIAIGDSIVPNTNCEATNVDTEITQLNSDIKANKLADGTGSTLADKLQSLVSYLPEGSQRSKTYIRVGNNVFTPNTITGEYNCAAFLDNGHMYNQYAKLVEGEFKQYNIDPSSGIATITDKSSDTSLTCSLWLR